MGVKRSQHVSSHFELSLHEFWNYFLSPVSLKYPKLRLPLHLYVVVLKTHYKNSYCPVWSALLFVYLILIVTLIIIIKVP